MVEADLPTSSNSDYGSLSYSEQDSHSFLYSSAEEQSASYYLTLLISECMKLGGLETDTFTNWKTT